MPSLKNLLMQQAGVPANLEANLPTGLPRISQVLTGLAQAAPDIAVPDIPSMPMGAMPGEGIPSVIKGIESAFSSTAYRSKPGASPRSIISRAVGGGGSGYRQIT